MKKFFTLLSIVFLLSSCGNTQKYETKININTSIIPLASITNYIWWDFVNVNALVPAGVSPHTFDLKPNQIIDLEKSDLIVYLDIEHIDWFLNKAIEGKNNVLAVKKDIEFLEVAKHDHDEDEEKHDENEHQEEKHDDHEEHSTDPHIWGNSENAYIIANHILKELVKLSPENSDYFNTNFASFKKELDLAKTKFKENTKNKKENNFIVFHDAYNYLFKEMGIDESRKHIFRKNLLNDPNSSEMKNLIDQVKEEWIKVAFKEPQLNSNNLKKFSSDYKINVFILDPLGTDTSKEWYIKNYKNNLKSLEKTYE
jgi:ABC-type Zn uptake system ZnuABC Zn-binding protein ZnuA